MKAPATRSLRRRVVALSGACVLVALLLASVFVVMVVRQRLVAGVDDEIERRITDVTSRVESDTLPDRISTFGDREDIVVQVVRDGVVVSASDNVADLAPLDRTCESGPDVVRFPRVDNSAFRVATTCVNVDGSTHVVHVAVNRDDVDESVRALQLALVFAVPVVVMVLSVALWWLVGRLLTRVEASAEREARFVADAAHELRSPLARMITTLEVDGPAATDTVLGDARGLARLTDDLLTLARLDSTAPLRVRPVDLDDVVFRVVEATRRQTGAIGIDVSGVSAAQIGGDERLLERVVANLVDNAVRFARTQVVVRLGTVGAEVELVVADDGPGIDPSLAPTIFDRFARGDDVRTPGSGGAGLGLAIVFSIVEAHRGTVRVEPSESGARFVVRLPELANR